MAKHATRSRLDLLRAVPLFSSCTDKELARIDALVDETEIEAGKVLIHEGRAGRESFVIAAGEAVVTLRGEYLATVASGAVIGEMAVLENQPRSATVTAATPMTLLALDPRSLGGLLAEASVATKVIKSLSARLRAVEGAPTYPPVAVAVAAMS